MWVLSKPLLPKSFSSDVSVLFFWSVAGRVAAASESCALWATLLLVAVCWGGSLESLCLGLFKASSCLPEYFECGSAGRCPGLALWWHSQGLGPSMEV